MIHYWGGTSTSWPGVAMTKTADTVYSYTVPAGTTGIIFNGNGNGSRQTVNIEGAAIKHGHIYIGMLGANGQQATVQDGGVYQVTGIAATEAEACVTVEYYTLQGLRVDNPVPGNIYLVRRGTTVSKVFVR